MRSADHWYGDTSPVRVLYDVAIFAFLGWTRKSEACLPTLANGLALLGGRWTVRLCVRQARNETGASTLGAAVCMTGSRMNRTSVTRGGGVA